MGEEHLLYVLAGKPRSISGGLLEKHQVRDAIRRELDEAMSHPEYLAGSNRVVDEEGNLLGHLFEGPDRRPYFEPSPDPD